ncbi:MAG: YqgE/AlgH family protein [Niabella sp.]
MNMIRSGSILIANPHLDDPNFIHTVVFLCEHSQEGSFGFVLNRPTTYTIDELVPELSHYKIPVFEGGPVELNTLHFLHQYPDLIPGSKEVMNGVYWGGSFNELITHIRKRAVDIDKIRFYLGYSGWDAGQLDAEMDEKAWISSYATHQLLFGTDYNDIWKSALKSCGKEYEMFINAPIDPRLN